MASPDSVTIVVPAFNEGESIGVVGVRDPKTQATAGRRLGSAVLNWLASYLTERPTPDLTSGFRAARRNCLLEFIHLLPNSFSTPTTTTLAFLKAGYNVAFEPIAARGRAGASKIRLASDGAKFLLILLKIVTIFSPLRIFAPRAVVHRWPRRAAPELHLSRAHSKRRRGAAVVFDHDHAGRAHLRADLDPALRRTPVVAA